MSLKPSDIVAKQKRVLTKSSEMLQADLAEQFAKAVEQQEIRKAQADQEQAKLNNINTDFGNSHLFSDSTIDNNVTAHVVNTGLGAVKGAGEIVGNVASAPFNVAAIKHLNHISEPDRALITKVQKGEATPEEIEYVNNATYEVPTTFTGGGIPQVVQQKYKLKDALDIFNELKDNGQGIKQGVLDVVDGGRFNPINQERTARELAFEYDKAVEQYNQADNKKDKARAIAKGFAGGIGAMVSNPAGTIDYMAENAPDILMGFIGKSAEAVDTTSRAIDFYASQVQDHINKTGELPQGKHQDELIKKTGIYAAANYIGDTGVIKAITRNKPKIKDPSLIQGVKEAGKRLGQASGAEYIAEGIQSALETDDLITDMSLESVGRDAFIGANIGAASSGGIATPSAVNALTERGDLTKRREHQLNQSKKAQEASKNQQTKADTSAYTDYLKNELKPGSASFETDTDAVLATIVSDFESQTQGVESYEQDETGEVGKNAVQQVNNARELLLHITNELSDLQARAGENPSRSQQKIIDSLARKQATVAEVFKSLKEKHLSLANPDKAVETATNTTSEQEQTTAITGLAEMAIQSTDSDIKVVTKDKLEGILDNPELSDNNRMLVSDLIALVDQQEEMDDLLAKGDAEDIDAPNAQQVSDTIQNGTKKFRGIRQYTAQITAAFLAGDTDKSQKLKTDFYAFKKGIKNKFKAMEFVLASTEKGSNADPKRVQKAKDYLKNEHGITYSKNGFAKLIQYVYSDVKALQNVDKQISLLGRIQQRIEQERSKPNQPQAPIENNVTQEQSEAPAQQINENNPPPATEIPESESAQENEIIEPTRVIENTSVSVEVPVNPTEDSTEYDEFVELDKHRQTLEAEIIQLASDIESTRVLKQKAVERLGLDGNLSFTKEEKREINKEAKLIRDELKQELADKKLFLLGNPDKDTDSEFDLESGFNNDFIEISNAVASGLNNASLRAKLQIDTTEDVQTLESEVTAMREEIAEAKANGQKLPSSFHERYHLKKAQLRRNKDLLKTLEAKGKLNTHHEGDKILDGAKQNFPEESNTWSSQWVRKFKASKAKKTLIAGIPNLVDMLAVTPELILRNLNVKTLTEKQELAVDTFVRFSQEVGERLNGSSNIKKLLTRTALRTELEDFDKKNLFKFLVAPKETVSGAVGFDKSVVAAFSAVIHNYIAFQAEDHASPNKGQLERIYGENIPAWKLQRMAKYGITEASLRSNFGRDVLNALGIIPDGSKMTTKEESELEAELGSMVIALMNDMGLVEFNQLTEAQITEELGTDEHKLNHSAEQQSANQKIAYISFLRPRIDFSQPKESRYPNDNDLRDIVENNKGTDHIMQELFESQSPVRPPSFSPIKKVANKYKRTKKKLAQSIQDILAKAQNRPYKYSKQGFEIMEFLDDEGKESVAGVVSQAELNNMQIDNKLTQIEANKTLQRELENYYSFSERLKETKEGLAKWFYLPLEAWRNQRIGYVSNLINPQTSSKVVRGLLVKKEWETTVKFSDTEKMSRFQLGVAQALGVDIDKLPQEEIQASFSKILNDPVILDAVNAIQAIFEGNTDNSTEVAYQAAIVTAVKQGGHATHTLHGLINLTRMLNAVDGEFKSDIWVEIDGVTNGVAISLSLFGAFTGKDNTDNEDELLRVAGVFTDVNDQDLATVKKASGLKDIYETMGVNWQTALSQELNRPRERKEKQINWNAYNFFADDRIFGDLASKSQKQLRKLAKSFTMTNVYGIGDKRLSNEVGQQVVQSVRDGIEAIVNRPFDENGTLTKEQHEAQKVKELNELNVQVYKAFKIPLFHVYQDRKYQGVRIQNSKEALGYSIKGRLEKVMVEEASNTFGTAAVNASSIVFENIREARKRLISAQAHINDIFVKLLQYKINLKKKDLNLGRDDDLTLDQMKEVLADINHVMPHIKTSFSENPEEQIQLAKEKRNVKNAKTSKQVQFDRPIANRYVHNYNNPNKPLHESSSISYRGGESGFVELGVSGGVLTIHSIDAEIAIKALGEFDILSVHDGFVSGIDDMYDLGKALNTAYAEGTLGRNVFNEVAEQLDNIRLEFISTVEQYDDTLSEDKKMLSDEIDARDLLPEPKEFNDERADEVWVEPSDVASWYQPKLIAFQERIKRITQYNIPGVGIDVTPEMMQEAKDKLSTLHKPLVVVDYEKEPTVITPKKVIPNKPKGTPEQLFENSKKFFFNVNQEAVYYASQRKVDGVEYEGEKVPLKAYLNYLIRSLSKVPNLNTKQKTQIELLRMVKNIVPKEAKFEITGLINYDTRIFGEGGSKVGIKSLTKKETIVRIANDAIETLRADKKVSPLEVVIHEALHAVTHTYLYIAQEQRHLLNENQLKAYDALQKQYEAFKKEANKRIANGEFSADELQWVNYALKNLDEFVSVGLSNQVVQGILKTMPSQGFKTQFKQFIKNIISLMGGKGWNNAHRELLETTIEIAKVVPELHQLGDIRALLGQPNAPINTQDSTLAPLAQMAKNAGRTREHVESMSMVEVFESLDGNQDEHNEEVGKLVGQVSQIVTKQTTIKAMMDAVGDELDQIIQDVIDGKPNQDKRHQGLFGLTDKERYAADVIEVMLRDQLQGRSEAVKELDKLYQQARAVLRVEDFLPDPSLASDEAEMAKAQMRYDFLFNPKLAVKNHGLQAITGRNKQEVISDYLVNFATIVAVNKPLKDKLADTATPERKVTGSWVSRFNQWLVKMFGWMSTTFSNQEEVTGNFNERIATVLRNLGKVEYHHRNQANSELSKLNQIDHKLNNAVSEQLVATIAKTAEVAKNTNLGRLNPAKNVVAEAVAMWGENRANHFFDALEDFSKRQDGTVATLIKNIMRDMRGSTDDNNQFVRIIRWANRGEQHAKQIKDAVMGQLDQFFPDLTEGESKALTKTLMMTDLASLIDKENQQESLQDILNLLESSEALEQAIEGLEKQLGQYKEGTYYITRTRALGYKMVTNKATVKNQPRNAMHIAEMSGYSKKINTAQAKQVTPIIDKLASLYALKYTSFGHKNLALKTLRKANSGALAFTLATHRRLQDQAKEKLFQGEERLYEKGFIPSITNPRISMEMARKNSPEHFDLLKRGFKEVHDELGRDPEDPHGHLNVILIREDGGMARYLTGAMQLADNQRKGTTMAKSGRTGGFISNWEARNDVAITKARLSTPEKETLAFDPTKKKPVRLQPVFNPRGEIVDYRYEMPEADQDKYLEKHYGLSQLMGTLAGTTITKLESRKTNQQLIDALHEQWTTDTKLLGAKYVTIHPKSDNPKLQEMWHMMPKATQDYAIKKFGKSGIQVREDMLDMVMGYRKGSLLEYSEKLKNTAIGYITKHALAFVIEKVTGNANALHQLDMYVNRGEESWTAVVKMIKDSFVVKNVFTSVFNILSNAMFLHAQGVPVIDIVKDQAKAWKEAVEYNKLRKEAQIIDNKIVSTTNPAMLKKLKANKNIVMHKIFNSPVHPLMEAGLFQTIVEDIDLESNQVQYRNDLEKGLDKLNAKLPEKAQKFGQEMFISHDTKLYNMLNLLPHMSDFTSRYTLHKHLTTQRNFSHEQAVDYVSEAFVNYDIPTDRTIQWLNDTGFIMFSKYYLRIQKMILMTLRDRPVSAVGQMVGASWLGMPTIWEQNVLVKDPLESLYAPWNSIDDAITEIAPINMGLHAIGAK